jgi:hypothetical protein
MPICIHVGQPTPLTRWGKGFPGYIMLLLNLWGLFEIVGLMQ